jgi:transposase
MHRWRCICVGVPEPRSPAGGAFRHWLNCLLSFLQATPGRSPVLNLTGSLRVFLGVEPVDLRKSLSGWLVVVMDRLKEDPLQGALFVFSNRAPPR